MRRIFCLSFLLQIFISTAIFSQNFDHDSLDVFLEKVMHDFQVPGMAVGIIQKDSIVFLEGYGLRAIGGEEKVNSETTFGIGSISKSFTALTIGMLVDEGLVSWDDPVRKYLPYFELYDPYVSDNFTIRDLLIHKSGLKSVSGGTLWYHSDLSREEVIKGMKLLKPESGFRSTTAYQNVMFVVAAEIVESVSDVAWDDFVEERLFKPLGMAVTTSRSEVREGNPNIARPHIWNQDFTAKTEIKQELGDNLAPAGFIYSSAKDMLNYMRLILSDGEFEEQEILSKESMNEILSPQSLFQISGPPFGNEFSSYGFGWWLTPYKGHKIIEHSGGIDGMAAQLVMVKDLDVGIIILSNVSKEPASFIIKGKFLEMALEDDAFDIYERGLEFRKKRIEELRKGNLSQKRIPNTKASLPLADYVGIYEDRMYGEINITAIDHEELLLSFSRTPLFRGKLSHWHHDTFKIDWDDIRVPDGFLTFNFSADQEVIGFKITQENLLDVDFGELEILRRK